MLLSVVQTVLLHQPVTLSLSVLQDHIHCLIIYLFYSSTPGDISVTFGGAYCAVTSVSNIELECVTGPHTLSDYISILQFHSREHQCDYRWCRLCCNISQ